MKTLIVVSGGDAPGINAAIWQYARVAGVKGDHIVGAQGGFSGLLSQQIVYFNARHIASVAMSPGSYLTSSHEPALSAADAESQLYELLERHAIDNVLLFGGSGTIDHVLPLLDKWHIPVVVIPATIENDVRGTEYTLGFDSACNYAYHAVDGARATASALNSGVFIIESVGKQSGILTLAIAEGAGADAVLIPEYPYEAAWLSERLKNAVERNGYALVIVAEGVQGVRTLADDLTRKTSVRVHDVRLGYAQRGGIPSHADRELAARMARLAHSTLKDGVKCGMIVVQSGNLSVHEGIMNDVPPRQPDRAIYDALNGL